MRKEGHHVFIDLREAIKELEAMLDNQDSEVSVNEVQAIIDQLVRTTRFLAVVAIEEAAATGASLNKVAEDRLEMTRGDAYVAAGNYDNAIQRYLNAWAHAVYLKMTLTKLPNGTVVVQCLATAGETYVLESSTDLVNWEMVGETKVGAEGNLRFERRAEPPRKSCFYRARRVAH